MIVSDTEVAGEMAKRGKFKSVDANTGRREKPTQQQRPRTAKNE